MMKYLLVILILCIEFSCSTTKNKVSDTIFFTTELEDSLNDTIYFKNSRILQLETNDQSLLRTITRIYYDNNRFFVFDKSLRKIVIFDIEGKYLNQIHAVGGGPTEYGGLMDFCLDTIRQHLVLLCDRPYQIMEFTYSGNFVESHKIDNLYFNIATDSKYIYCNQRNMQMDNLNTCELICMDREYNTISKYLPMSEEDTKVNHLYKGNNLTSTFSACYTRQFDNSIYMLVDGQFIQAYSIDFGKYNFPVNLLGNGKFDFSAIVGEKQCIYAINEVVDSPNYLLFNTNIGFFVLNKKNNVLKGYQTLYDSNLQIGRNNYFSIGNTQMLAIHISPSFIHNIVGQQQKLSGDMKNTILLELAEKIKEDDNPVLVLYDMK